MWLPDNYNSCFDCIFLFFVFYIYIFIFYFFQVTTYLTAEIYSKNKFYEISEKIYFQDE